MAKTSSNPVPLNSMAPNFNLPEPLTGQSLELQHLSINKGLMIAFICNHCPFVKLILSQLVHVANQYIPQGIAFIAINANDIIAYPEDAPEKMVELAQAYQFPFPYLYDETQTIAKSYQAACTPDFFLYNEHKCLIYHGQFDEARPGQTNPVTGDSLIYALNKLLNHQPINIQQKPSIGCGIKWK